MSHGYLACVLAAFALMASACAPTTVSELKQNNTNAEQFTSALPFERVHDYIVAGATKCYSRRIVQVSGRTRSTIHRWWVTDTFDDAKKFGTFTVHYQSVFRHEILAHGEVSERNGTTTVRMHSANQTLVSINKAVRQWATGNIECPEALQLFYQTGANPAAQSG